jgi:predicted nucleic acid-binding protein
LVLIDASVWVDFFNGVEPALTEVARLIRRDQALVAGVAVAEVLRGIKDAARREETREALLGLRYVEETVDTWIRTGELGRSLDAVGKVLPLADLHLSALAQQVGAVVYSTDKHFQKVPGIRLHQPASIK